ncbi:MAG TPA: DegV family protein [Firmicutes bacterium]|nr:DegV family protein [Bacillota bacterium]
MSGKIAVVTDSNSGITQAAAKELGIFVVPMPFVINKETYYEDISLTQGQFYEMLQGEADISTSQPTVGHVLDLWDSILQDYDELVHIPMSSGLSGSCATALALSADYDGRVAVVNNQRISVTQRQSVMDALALAKAGKSAEEIRDILEQVKFESSIYIMLDTLKYLKKGGRVTPAAAAVATVLRIKPVLQIQGEKLDAFAKARSERIGRGIMIDAMRKDINERFGGNEQVQVFVAHTNNEEAAHDFARLAEQELGIAVTYCDPLSLSVSCHIGPGALAIACSKKIDRFL